ncbi:MAG: hypothetical protein GY862_29635 [Gammaproteobacteria bacterium]|nr:hypothetical protein [Gammaproteobacteria bacterium]
MRALALLQQSPKGLTTSGFVHDFGVSVQALYSLVFAQIGIGDVEYEKERLDLSGKMMQNGLTRRCGLECQR